MDENRINAIFCKLDEIRNSVGLIEKTQEVIIYRMDEAQNNINDVKKRINGNGKMGIESKVSILWAVSIFLTVSVAGLIFNLLANKL